MNGDQVKEQGVWSERLSQGPGLHSFAFHQSFFFFFSLRGETSDNKTEENETERWRGRGGGEDGGVVVENMMG